MEALGSIEDPGDRFPKAQYPGQNTRHHARPARSNVCRSTAVPSWDLIAIVIITQSLYLSGSLSPRSLSALLAVEGIAGCSWLAAARTPASAREAAVPALEHLPLGVFRSERSVLAAGLRLVLSRRIDCGVAPVADTALAAVAGLPSGRSEWGCGHPRVGRRALRQRHPTRVMPTAPTAGRMGVKPYDHREGSNDGGHAPLTYAA